DKKLTFKKPQLSASAAATLTWRENISRFIQEVNTFDQPTKSTTASWDPKQVQTNTAPSQKGDEYGTQGGTVTGADLVKKMFGEFEQSTMVAGAAQNLLEAVAKSDFNARGGAFVNAEGRVKGNAAIRAGAVVEVQKAGARVDGQYYVVSTVHIFFADT